MRWLLPLLIGLAAAPAAAREALGTFGGWAAFRDLTPRRCYAIGQPEPAKGQAPTGGSLAIAFWPAAGAAGQLHARLGPAAPRGGTAMLAIGARRFPLRRQGRDLWAADAAADAAIAPALRSGETIAILVRDGRAHYTDLYPPRGLATAIDAAALACAAQR
ncbi:MAG: hypothetical protein PGN09_14330 [Sphingomonas fennica]